MKLIKTKDLMHSKEKKKDTSPIAPSSILHSKEKQYNNMNTKEFKNKCKLINADSNKENVNPNENSKKKSNCKNSFREEKININNDGSLNLLNKKIPKDFHSQSKENTKLNSTEKLNIKDSKKTNKLKNSNLKNKKLKNENDLRLSLSLNSENDEEVFFDFQQVNRLEDMQIRDPRIVDENLDKLKINPYEILIKLKNREKEFNIKESNLVVNTFANIDPEKFMNKCIIESDYLGIKSEGLGKTKKLSRLYAAQEFLYKIYSDYNWGKLESIFLNL